MARSASADGPMALAAAVLRRAWLDAKQGDTDALEFIQGADRDWQSLEFWAAFLRVDPEAVTAGARRVFSRVGRGGDPGCGDLART